MTASDRTVELGGLTWWWHLGPRVGSAESADTPGAVHDRYELRARPRRWATLTRCVGVLEVSNELRWRGAPYRDDHYLVALRVDGCVVACVRARPGATHPDRWRTRIVERATTRLLRRSAVRAAIVLARADVPAD